MTGISAVMDDLDLLVDTRIMAVDDEALSGADRRVRIAARALGRTGLAHAEGHCSERLDRHSFVVCAARPMGLIAPGEAGVVVPIVGPLPPGAVAEIRLHQQIYQRRSDVHAIARSMPPQLMTLSTARRVPQARHGLGAYFGAGAALWDDPQPIRDERRAIGLAKTLGAANAIVLRGNGVVVVASSLAEAVTLTWFLEDAARVELSVHAAGLLDESVVLSSDECKRRASGSSGLHERTWQFLTAGDPELG